MNKVLDFIYIGAGVILACGIITFAFNAFTNSTKIAVEATKEQNDFAYELTEYDITKYEGKEVSGSDVVNYIGKNLGEYINTETAPFYINVVTALSVNTYTNNVHIADIKNFTTPMYIKPESIFICNVSRDGNNVITGVIFTQK